jgi:hypothetical protein
MNAGSATGRSSRTVQGTQDQSGHEEPTPTVSFALSSSASTSSSYAVSGSRSSIGRSRRPGWLAHARPRPAARTLRPAVVLLSADHLPPGHGDRAPRARSSALRSTFRGSASQSPQVASLGTPLLPKKCGGIDARGVPSPAPAAPLRAWPDRQVDRARGGLCIQASVIRAARVTKISIRATARIRSSRATRLPRPRRDRWHPACR